VNLGFVCKRGKHWTAVPVVVDVGMSVGLVSMGKYYIYVARDDEELCKVGKSVELLQQILQYHINYPISIPSLFVLSFA
jgi:hypothetical protein